MNRQHTLILRYACGHCCELHIQHRCVLKVITVVVPCSCKLCEDKEKVQ